MGRLDLDRLGRLAVVVALVLGVGSAVVSPLFRTASFGDGSLYLFAALTPNPWDTVWFNFPLRASVFALEILPTWLTVRITGDAEAGAIVYSLIRGSWPLLTLLATMAIEERGAVVSRAAAFSIVVAALPTTFFPTEIFLTHTLFWPFLAALVRRSEPSAMLVGVLALPLAFTHEAGLLLVASACVWSAVVRQPPRIQAVLGAVILAWFAVRHLAPPPTAEMAHAMAGNRVTFLLPKGLLNRVSIATMAAIAAFAISRKGVWRIPPCSLSTSLAAACAAAGIVYGGQLLVSAVPIGDQRYTFRTITFLAMTLVSAGLVAWALAERLRPDLPGLARVWLFRHEDMVARIAGLVLLLTAVGQTVEAGIFLRQWTRLEQILAGPPPRGEDMPHALTLRIAGQPPVEGQARHPDPAWGTSWTWAMPFHSLTANGPLTANFIIVPTVRRTFVPIDCQRLMGLDASSTPVPEARLTLLRDYFCDPTLVHAHH